MNQKKQSPLEGLRLEFNPVSHSVAQDVSESYQHALDGLLSFQSVFREIGLKINSFPQKIEEAKKKSLLIVDFDKAEKLFQKVIALFEISEANPWKEHVPFSLAAINYFFDEEDASADFEEFDGFDDDEEILNAVIAQFELGSRLEVKLKEIKEREKLSA